MCVGWFSLMLSAKGGMVVNAYMLSKRDAICRDSCHDESCAVT